MSFTLADLKCKLDNSQKCEPMLIFLSSLMHQAFAVRMPELHDT